MVEVSAVVPTYNRLATLRRCLAALEEQTLDRARYEIIVVDDCSSDGTADALAERPGLRILRQPQNSGPAAARNVGIRAARGALVLLLGDDIIARPRLLEQHVAAHAACPGEHVAVLGYTQWDAAAEITPLMRYLSDGRAFQQFRYHAITDPDDVPYGRFYSCNVSLSRAFFLRHGLFDEEFRRAYGEDTELAYRLKGRGMRLVFRREIVADHRHVTSYRSACHRARVAGEVGLLMSRKHPELASVAFLHSYGRKTRASIWFKRRVNEWIVDPLLDRADHGRLDHPMLARLYDWALRKHQLWGLMDAVAHHGLPR